MVTIPAPTPVTTPAGLTSPMVTLLLLQTPPETVLASVAVVPRQSAVLPDITPADGIVSTFNVVVAKADPQPVDIR